MGFVSAAKRLIPERYKPLSYLQRLTSEKTRDRVIFGPFEGLILASRDTPNFSYVPKVLGIYEKELHTVVEEICERSPRYIINVGANDGYYAIGLSRRLPDSRIIAFEADAKERVNLAKNAELNGVATQIQLRGFCDIAELTECMKNRAQLVICDVEGYEETLLDPMRIPALAEANILVETHDFILPGITRLIERRFENSHDIRHIQQQPRASSDFPWRTLRTALFPSRYLDLIVSERRPAIMTWLWMRATR